MRYNYSWRFLENQISSRKLTNNEVSGTTPVYDTYRIFKDKHITKIFSQEKHSMSISMLSETVCLSVLNLFPGQRVLNFKYLVVYILILKKSQRLRLLLSDYL